MTRLSVFLISLTFILSSLISKSQVISTTGGGNWSSTSTWQGGVVPTATDIVLILGDGAGGGAVSIDSDVTVADLYVVNDNNNVLLKGGSLFATFTLTITGQLGGILFDLSNFAEPTTTVIENDQRLNIVFTGTGTSPNISIWGHVSALRNVTTSGNVTFEDVAIFSNSSLTISSGSLTISNGFELVDQAASASISVSGSLNVNGAINGGASSSDFGTVTATGTGIINIGTSGYLNSENLNLSSGSNFNIANNQPSGWWHSTSAGPAGGFIDANSTVSYIRLGSQGVRAGTYGNLTVSSGGAAATKTLSSTGTLTVQGNFTLGTSTTLFTNSNTSNIFFQGNITNDGVLALTRPTTFNGGGTQLIDGASAITFNSAVTFSNAINIDSDVTFGSSVSSGGNSISFAKDMINNGTIITSGTLVFDGALAQSIGGTNSTLVNNLSITNPSQTVSVNGGGTIVYGTLTVGSSSTFNANGNLALRSNGSGTARVAEISGSGTITGSVIYQRYINGAQEWHNIGIPVGGSTTDISGSGYPVPGNDLGRYNETVAGDMDQGWETADLPFSAISDTRGYSLWTRTADDNGTLIFTGTLNTGNVTLPITRTIQNGLAEDGWNLVSNPYASQIDWGSGSWTKTRIDATIAVWNGISYNYLNGSGTIASGQAFWVHANAASPVLTARQGVKTSSGATFYRTTDDVVPDQLSVTLQDGEFSDLARIRFIDDATEEFDTQYDGYKLQNNIFNLSSLSEGGMDLSINTLPMLECSRVVKLNMTNITEGTYQVKFDGLYSFETAYDFTLIDNFLTTSTTISENYSYDFSVTADAASWGSTRFEIEFSAASIDSNVMYSIDNKCGLGAAVLITNAQAGINYILSQNGAVIESQLATSSTLEIALSADEISAGFNQFDLSLDNNGCNNTLLIKNGIEFTVIGVQEITATTNGLSCGTGQVSIKAEGATGNGYYRWYESVEAIDPIPNQNSNEYLTPSSDATKFYYVTVVNESGCESSTRTKVIAEIMNVTQPIISVEGDVIITSAIADNYIWYKDGLLIEGENTESIAVVESGAYSVEVITNTCSATSENIIVEILGVKDLKEYGIEIYPNPVLDIMTINSELTINSIFIFDTKGIEVMRIENNIPNEIDMKNIKKGIYIINIATDNQIITYRVRKK